MTRRDYIQLPGCKIARTDIERALATEGYVELYYRRYHVLIYRTKAHEKHFGAKMDVIKIISNGDDDEW